MRHDLVCRDRSHLIHEEHVQHSRLLKGMLINRRTSAASIAVKEQLEYAFQG